MTNLLLAIALVLLNRGLIPEQHTMSTCLEISQDVATDTQKPELVVDYNGGDFTPTRQFLRVINDAHRYLDRRHSHEARERVKKINIVQCDYLADIPAGLKYITRIDLEDSRGNIIPNGGLQRRTIDGLRDLYGQRFDLVANGQPTDWARDYAPTNYREILSNPNFDTGDDGWEIEERDNPADNPTVTWANGKITITAGALPGALRMNIPPTDLTNARIVVDVSAITPPENPEAGGSLSFSAGYTEDPTHTNGFNISIPSIPGIYSGFWDGDLALVDYIEIAVFTRSVVTLNSVSIRIPDEADVSPIGVERIVFLPPADTSYKLVVHHTAYAKKMESNQDVSWWSDKYPEILALAVKREIEVSINQSDTRAKFFEDKVQEALWDLDTDAAMEEQAGPDLRYRFGWRP